MRQFRMAMGATMLCVILSACRSPQPQPQPPSTSIPASRPTLISTVTLPCQSGAGTAWRTWRSGQEPVGITTLLADGDTLWAGTAQGLVRVDLRTDAATTHIHAQEMGRVGVLLPLEEKRVWAQTESGCFYYDGQQWTGVNGSTACKYATTWGIDQNGDLWGLGYTDTRFYTPYYAHFAGRVPLRGETWEPIEAKSGPDAYPTDNEKNCPAWQSFASNGLAYRSSSECQAMIHARQTLRSKIANWYGIVAVDTNGSIWYSYDMALGHLEADGMNTTMRFGTRIYALASDPKHGVWVGTGDGLAYYDGQRVQWMPLELGACTIPEVTHGLAVDAHGIAWVGTTSGVLTLRPENLDWRPLTGLELQGEQANGPVSAMVADADGRVWATDNLSLWQFGGPTVKLATPLPLPGCYFENLLIDTAGNVWGAVAPCGALRFNPTNGQWSEYHFFRSNQGPMTMGADGTLYILGTDGLRAYASASSEWRLVASLKATTIAADRQGGVWVGLRDTGELWRYRNGQIESLGKPFDERVLQRLFVDSRNRLWAAADGLKLYDGRAWRSLPLAVGAIRELTSGPNGRVWILGASGVAVYDPAADKQP
jgi:ligand-binding sensor domain-containing protein